MPRGWTTWCRCTRMELVALTLAFVLVALIVERPVARRRERRRRDLEWSPLEGAYSDGHGSRPPGD